MHHSGGYVNTQLPLELIDNIVDYLSDSPSDLRTCALVCRAWVASSRLHLFHSISIYPGRRSVYARCCRLRSTIRRCPGVALNVRELCFSIGSRRVNDSLSVMDDLEWPRLKNVLPDLLRSFTKLRKLKLMNIEWRWLMPLIRAAFRDVLTLPSLIHFEPDDMTFSTMEEFTSVIRPQLKRLAIRSSIWPWGNIRALATDVVDNDQGTVLGQPPCCLEYLELSVMTDIGLFDWILHSRSIVDLSKVHTLDATGYSWLLDGFKMNRLIETLGLSLEHLIIRLKTKWWGAFSFHFSFLQRSNCF
jgi:hypothetical protein